MLDHLSIAIGVADDACRGRGGRSASGRDRGPPQPAQPRLDVRDFDRRRARLRADRPGRRRTGGRHRGADAPWLPGGDARPRARRRLASGPPHRLGQSQRPCRQRSAHAGRGDAVRLRRVLGDGAVAVQGLVLEVHYPLCGDRAGPVAGRVRRHAGDHRRRGLLHPGRPEDLPRAGRSTGRARAGAAGAAGHRLAADGADGSHQPVAGAVPAVRRASGRLRRRRRRAAIRDAVGDAGPRPLCRRLRRLPHRPRFGARARRRRRPAGDRHRRRRRLRRRPRPGLATVRAAVLRRLLPDDRLFDRLHRPRRDRQSLLLLRLPDDRLADRRRDGARARQLLRLLGADDLDLVLPGHPRTDSQGAARRPRLLPDVRGGRLSDEFRHPADARPDRLVRARRDRRQGRRRSRRSPAPRSSPACSSASR